jgi:hypothetical protein
MEPLSKTLNLIFGPKGPEFHTPPNGSGGSYKYVGLFGKEMVRGADEAAETGLVLI